MASSPRSYNNDNVEDVTDWGLVSADSLRYHDANDPAFPGTIASGMDVKGRAHWMRVGAWVRRLLDRLSTGRAGDWTATDMPSIVMVPALLFKPSRSAKTSRSVPELLRPETIPGTCCAFRLFNKAGRGLANRRPSPPVMPPSARRNHRTPGSLPAWPARSDRS
jgi:hypothetical protein